MLPPQNARPGVAGRNTSGIATTARVRVLSSETSNKNDPNDAFFSVAVAALHAK